MRQTDDNEALDPWLLKPEQLDSLEHDVRHLIGPNVEWVLRPRPRSEQVSIVDRIARLPWTGDDVERTVREAFAALVDGTVPGGPIDPSLDESDVPWCEMLGRLVHVPVLGSKRARQWFALLQRFRWADVPVSTIPEGVAAYAVALMEHLRGRESESDYWTRLAAIQNEDDDRVGMGVAVAIRAARLLSGGACVSGERP